MQELNLEQVENVAGGECCRCGVFNTPNGTRITNGPFITANYNKCREMCCGYFQSNNYCVAPLGAPDKRHPGEDFSPYVLGECQPCQSSVKLEVFSTK